MHQISGEKEKGEGRPPKTRKIKFVKNVNLDILCYSAIFCESTDLDIYFSFKSTTTLR
jgi:hypothetical protein